MYQKVTGTAHLVWKGKRGGTEDGERLCFQFLSSDSCSQGESYKFRHDTDNKNPFLKGACFDFISKGKCERSAECKFRHSSDDGGGSSDLLPPGICFDFVRKGRCDKGDDCRFSHDPDAGKKGRNAVSNTHQPCWFCLSSTNLDTHLIVSVGDNFFCTLAKGPLVEEHVLIVPIEHLPSTLSLPSDSDSELQKFKHALKRYFRKHGNAMIVFERYLNPRAANHAHLQVVPIPLSKASTVRSEFVMAGKKLGFEFDVIRPAGENDIDVRMSLKKHSEKQVKLHNAQLSYRNIELYDKSQEVKQRHEKKIEINKLLMKENACLYKKIRLLRLQLKEQAVPATRPLGLEALAQIATSMEGELQAETHQEEITSLVREKGASSKKP